MILLSDHCHIQQSDYDQLLVNLQMEASCAKEGMTFTWKAEVGHPLSS